MHTVSLRTDEVCQFAGYVYVAVATKLRHGYVGQTRGRGGALARLSQHLVFRPAGTMRERVETVLGSEIDSMGPIEFAAVRLAAVPGFHAEARDYREAVEGLCQYHLINHVSDAPYSIGFVSRVRLNGYSREKAVTDEAARVSYLLITWLDALQTSADQA